VPRRLLTACCLAAALCACTAAPPSARTAWERRQGGTVDDPAAARRAAAALRRLLPDAPSALALHLLDTSDPVAYSFPDGSLYLSRALARQLPDDALAATLAHELGHLLLDGHLRSPESLRGLPLAQDADVERAADRIATRLLRAAHIPPAALAAALEHVADASQNSPFAPALRTRAAAIKSLPDQP
jgi:hypothetical protein